MSIDRRMDKEDVVRIYNGILLSHKKENEVVSYTATWMDLETVILGEVSQKEKDKSHLYEILRFVKIRDRRLNSSCWGAGGVVWMRSYLIGTEF